MLWRQTDGEISVSIVRPQRLTYSTRFQLKFFSTFAEEVLEEDPRWTLNKHLDESKTFLPCLSSIFSVRLLEVFFKWNISIILIVEDVLILGRFCVFCLMQEEEETETFVNRIIYSAVAAHPAMWLCKRKGCSYTSHASRGCTRSVRAQAAILTPTGPEEH